MLSCYTAMRSFKKLFVPRPNHAVIPNIQEKTMMSCELEIGAGNGEFAVQRAKQHPCSQFIAIEKSRTRFNQFMKNYHSVKPDNLWFFHTNAVWWITHFVKAQSLSKVYIFYPNCYSKPSQANLRWSERSFMPFLLERLQKGGQLELRTNKVEYYEQFQTGMSRFSFIAKKPSFSLINALPCTAFERKYMNDGQQCWSVIYTRII